jgi:predicted dinucleotide-binding enzyme
MRVAVLGTGTVGTRLADRLRELGHDVRVGSRDGSKGDGTFGEVAAAAELVVNATAGAASVEALEQAGEENLSGKVLLDVANPLDFSRGMPPTLTVCNDDSLGERIQRRFPGARVVKSLNTVNNELMVKPSLLAGDHDLFVCGDDDGAKAEVVGLLESFGWPRERILDLGGIQAARAMEMYLPLWLALLQATGTPHVNVHVVR